MSIFSSAKSEWSKTSQRRALARAKLEGQLSTLDHLVAITNKKISGLEQEKASQMQSAISDRGTGYSHLRLQDTLKELVGAERTRAEYIQRQSSIRADLEALEFGPEALEVRAAEQDRMARLIRERSGKDGEIDKLIARLCQALQERAQLTARIAQSAELLEISSDHPVFDEQRFDELSASLPEDLGPASQRLPDFFLGAERGTDTFVVVADVVLPETLVNAGVLRSGERIELTRERVAMLNSKSGTKPRLLTVEEFEKGNA